MLIKRPTPGDTAGILPSEITSEQAYLSRRTLIQAGIGAALGAVGLDAFAQSAARPLKFSRNAQFSLTDEPNSFDDITTYNNFYEFGTGKADPAANSGKFNPSPWSVSIAGEAESTGTFSLEDLLKGHALEERIYRLRCVEAWSMVIPWVGIPLSAILRRYKPTSKAKYVAFETVMRPTQMPGQRSPVLDWPYVEGLRMDEAMHPLTLLAVGLYGKSLLNQNGAPLRLVVPWKYGFKSIKSIVGIRFTEREPPTSWNRSAANEYGFYANVNPTVDHPRWSQARERVIGGGFLSSRVPTRMFNGYEKEVARLYQGMDLRKFY